MSIRLLYGFTLILLFWFASVQINTVNAGEKEIIAKKLIKLFLATAILSPPGIGLFPLPLPLPIPLPFEKLKPPIIAPPYGFHGGIPPIPFFSEEFHHYFLPPPV